MRDGIMIVIYETGWKTEIQADHNILFLWA